MQGAEDEPRSAPASATAVVRKSSPIDNSVSEQQRLLELAERMSGVGHWRYDLTCGKISWSDEVYKIHGVTRQTFDPELDSAVQFYHQDDQAKTAAHLDHAAKTGEGFAFELRIRRADGKVRDVVSKAECLRNDQGVVVTIYGVFQDITNQKNALRSLEQERARLQLLTDNVADVIAQIGLDGTSNYISPSIKDLLGYAPKDMKSSVVLDYVFGADRPILGAAFADMAAGADQRIVQHRATHKDGRTIWVESRFQMVRTGSGEPLEIVAVIRDISQRKAMEAENTAARHAAQELARRAEVAEAIAGLGHWRLEATGLAMTWSSQMYALYGIEPGTPLTLPNLVQFTHPDDSEIVAARLRRQIETGASDDNSLTRIIRVDGEIRYLSGSSKAELDAQGRVRAIIGTVVDVTEQKLADAALAESEANFRSLAEHSTDILVRFGRDGLISYISPACRMLGVEPEDAVGQSIIQLVAPDHQAHSKALVEGLFRGMEVDPEVRRLHHLIDRNGRDVWLEGSPKAICDGTGQIVEVVTVLRDVTSTRRAEAALSDSEQRYRRLAETAPDMICESTLDGTITYVSPACVSMTGYSAAELVGRSSFSLMSPEDGAGMVAMCQTVLASNGAIAPWPVEFRLTHKDGYELWFEAKPTPVTDPATMEICGFIDIIRDISARKALEAQLRQAQVDAEAATAVKAEFLANMSHELRTPLTSIIGFTGLAVEQPELSPLTRGFVERVANASRALLSTVNDVLDFSKLEAGQVTIAPAPVAIEQLFRSTLDLFTPQAGVRDLELALRLNDLAPDLAVFVDADRVRQVLLNLVGNAVKFTPSGGVTLSVHHDGVPGSLMVEVFDTGPGIARDKVDSLFKRFSQIDGSLTRAHGGTGLGLAICKGLVEAMGGEIGVNSVPGQGSRFWFRIPAPVAEALKVASVEVAQPRSEQSGLRVLVADDHPANRELAGLFLAGIGAEITEACDGQAAVDTCATTSFDIILMDLRMPGLDGIGALQAIRAAGGPNSEIPILAFTADASEDLLSYLTGFGFNGVVAKPLSPAALIQAVSQALSVDEVAETLREVG